MLVSDLGDLLELLCGAGDRVPGLTATVRDWHDFDLEQVAQERARAAGEPTAAMVSYGPRGRLGGTLERVEQLVMADGGRCWRVEQLEPAADQFGRSLVGPSCCDGTTTWHRMSPTEVLVEPARRLSSSANELLEPSWLAGYRLGESRPSRRGDRPTLVISCERRAVLGGSVVMVRPAQVEVEVDVELGFLHRMAGLVEGRPFHEVELVEVSVGRPEDPDVFVYRPEPDVVIVDQAAWQARHHVGPAGRVVRAVRWQARRRQHRKMLTSSR